MKTIIYLVRHGEVNNPNRVVYGRLPGFGLSENGRRQAHALGKHLSSRRVHVIYSSPLERARETAQIISSYQKKISVVYDELLIEVNSPQYEGKSMQEADAIHWDFYQEEFFKLGQEKVEDMWKRIDAALQSIVKNHKGKEIVVVSHGDPIMMTIAKLLGHPLRASEIDRTNYVPTANGFMLIFDESGAVEVSKLEIQRT